MISCFKISLLVLLQIALIFPVSANDELEEYLLDLSVALQKSRSVVFFDAENKTVVMVKGKKSRAINNYYEKLFENRNTSCIIVVLRENVDFGGRKTYFIWGDETSILTHEGNHIKVSIFDMLKKIEKLN
jgi:hypothetical protein